MAKVKITKMGAAPIGVKAKAPGGAFIHQRKSSPKSVGGDYITLKRGGKLLRMKRVAGKTKTGKNKFAVQSVLTSTKKGKK